MPTEKAKKLRVDRLVVKRGLASTREKAQALILAGQILVNEQKIDKCGAMVDADAALRLLGEPMPYVSRGGVKLAGALDHFRASPAGKVCLDIGASTGGFTDCLLERGARRVIAVDVGTHQLDWKLRRDPRVTVLEKTNARYLQPEQIASKCAIATMDVSFISATLILPVLPALLESGAEVLVLVKPQFEVGRGQVGKGGIVRDATLQAEAVAKVAAKLQELGFSRIESVESCLPGAEGNREFFLHAFWEKPA
jgi:23S rRNA (cytidine1920-2'-O)/16S rRNA (cytidine1409-2'-O)-methyltransferase